MPISRKQRVQMVLARERPDRLPTNIIYTPRMGEALASHYRVPLEELPRHLDRHMVTVLPDDKKAPEGRGGVRYDAWHVGWSTTSEGFHVVEHPLRGPQDLGSLRRPDPMDPDLLVSGQRLISDFGREMFICGGHGFVLCEGAACLLGFEDFMACLATDRDFIAQILDLLTDYHVSLARRMVSLGVDGGFTGDDWGSQRGMLISPRLWRLLVKPRISRIWQVYKEARLPVLHHSCGDVTPILDDLVEMGLDLLNPVQPGAMDHDYVARRYGGRLSFAGGICNQFTLPFGSPARVRDEVKQTIERLGRHGGYMIGPSHEMTTDVPMANVEAMIGAIQEVEPWS